METNFEKDHETESMVKGIQSKDGAATQGGEPDVMLPSDTTMSLDCAQSRYGGRLHTRRVGRILRNTRESLLMKS